MTSRDFCFWLQGAFEVNGGKALDEAQIAVVRAHLALVFKHEIDPSMGDDKHQAALNEVHAGAGVMPKPHVGGGAPPGTIMRC